MKYKVIIKESAQKQLKKLPAVYLKKATEIILNLEDDPRPRGCKKLTGGINGYRIRMGTYRIIYQIEDDVLIIYIFDVDHRKQVYR